MSGTTPDLTESNVEKLKQLFPEIITDGKIDFEKLEILLGKEIDDTPERYNFTWHGKKETMQFAQQPSNGTLRPIKEKSKNWDTTENLYIEGDNLEVLKLLQKSYNNKVKMIYIDPPYNTGNEFVYKDEFKDNLDYYLESTGQKDEEGIKFNSNTESNGRYHTDWLNMMYPRLKLARNLLCEEGVIFISIDDHEESNLVKICDEIFGEKNRIALICHKSRASVSNDKIISPNHNRVLFYCKNINILNNLKNLIGEDPNLTGFDLDDKDGKGPYRLAPVDGPGGAKKGNPYYEFMGVEGYFRYSKGTMKQKFNEGLIVKKANSLYQKYYKSSAEASRKTVTTWWDDVSYTSSATSQLKRLMEGESFDTPKPLELIIRMLKMMTYNDSNAVILDFFSGSSTTAHATMKLNSEDGGNRKFIMVQLPELLEEKSVAYKNGYHTICDIGEERIRRAGEKVKKDLIEKNNKEGMLLEKQINPEQLDIGFKVFSLDTSNLKEWQAEFDDIEVNIDLLEGNLVDNRLEEDLLYEIILKNGLDLTYPINEIISGESKIYDVAFGNLFVCLNDKINRNVADKIASLREEYGIETSQVVFKDSGFENDTEKLNCYEILKAAGYQEADLLSI